MKRKSDVCRNNFVWRKQINLNPQTYCLRIFSNQNEGIHNGLDIYILPKDTKT